MEKRFTVFGFLSKVFMIYGITTGLLNVFCILFGDMAKDFSTMFSLAGKGVSVATSMQFLLAVTAVIIMRMVFMTDMLIKDMALPARITAMFASVFALMIVFILIFGWFPSNDPLAWILFAVCFTVSCAVSVMISTAAERQENRRLEEALHRIKNDSEGEK